MNKTSDGSAQELDDDGASLLELPPSSWLDDNMANCVMAFGGCIMAIGFGIGYGRARKPITSVISGLCNGSMTLKTKIIYLLRHQVTLRTPRKSQISSNRYFL